MKIAIMTQPLGQNYGGIMQAWALQQVLKDMGYIPTTIDRQLNKKNIVYRSLRLGYRGTQKIIGNRVAPINFESNFKKILKLNLHFIDENINLSKTLDSEKKLSNHFKNETYDAVIVGSDQTWRPKYSPNIKNFFLDFIENENILKIAYATSFGVDNWEFNKEDTKLCADLAKKFDAISVREDSGIQLCREYLGVNANHVLDPTLLLTSDRYKTLYKNNTFNEKNKIYTYILDPNDWKHKIVEETKKTLNLPTYSHQPKYNLTNLVSKNIDDYHMPSIEGWLAGFANSSFVITDSFHGTVFSILFNKPFLSLINSDRGSSRFHSLTKSLHLESRLIEKRNAGNIDKLITEHINYNQVSQKLLELREYSLETLSKFLKNED